MDAESGVATSSRSSHGVENEAHLSEEALLSESSNQSQFTHDSNGSQDLDGDIKEADDILRYGTAQYTVQNLGAARIILLDAAHKYGIIYGSHSFNASHAESHFMLGKVLMEMTGSRSTKLLHLDSAGRYFKKAREILNRLVSMQIENMPSVPENIEDDAYDRLQLTNAKVQEIGILLRMIARRVGRLMNEVV